jgi:CheY-like chemotaxis protein
VPDSITVLVVDDEDLVRALMEDSLEEAGFTVETATSAAQAISMLEAAGANYKALVTDVNLGAKLTGWDVGKRARELMHDIPVVYMSGFAGNEWTANGVPNSILLNKPFAPAQLVTAVSQLLNAVPPSPIA